MAQHRLRHQLRLRLVLAVFDQALELSLLGHELHIGSIPGNLSSWY
jgi:hypothetical protein